MTGQNWSVGDNRHTTGKRRPARFYPALLEAASLIATFLSLSDFKHSLSSLLE